MPTRLLREGILTSDRVDQLDYPAEVFYRRLMGKVDDHGLYDARLSVLRSSLYPLRVDRVREADISRWIAACVKAGLIVLYEAGVKPYLKMLDTKWAARSEAKHPLPPANSCKQLQTDVSLVVDVDVCGVPRKRGKRPMPPDFHISDRVLAWADSKGIHNLDAHFEFFVSKARAKGYSYADWDEALMGAVRADWAQIGDGKKRVALG